MNLAEAVEHQVFQKLASDASSAHHEHPRLRFKLVFESCICEKQTEKNQSDRRKEGGNVNEKRNCFLRWAGVRCGWKLSEMSLNVHA